MEKSVEQLKATLSGLPTEQRAEIAAFLLETLEPEEDDAVQAWNRELDRRIAEIESGKAVGIPAEEVLAVMRAKYP